jgi:hypothetical protein
MIAELNNVRGARRLVEAPHVGGEVVRRLAPRARTREVDAVLHVERSAATRKGRLLPQCASGLGAGRARRYRLARK